MKALFGLSRICQDLNHWVFWLLKGPHSGPVPSPLPLAQLTWRVTWMGCMFPPHLGHSPLPQPPACSSTSILKPHEPSDLHGQTLMKGISPSQSGTLISIPKAEGRRWEKTSCFKFTLTEWLHLRLSHVPLPGLLAWALLTLASRILPLEVPNNGKTLRRNWWLFYCWPELGVGWAFQRTHPRHHLIWSFYSQSSRCSSQTDLAFYRLMPKELVATTKIPKPWKLFVSAKPKAQLYTKPKNQVALISHFWLILPGHILKPNGLN